MKRRERATRYSMNQGLRRVLRHVLCSEALNGAAVGFGLLLVTALVYLAENSTAATGAGVGAIIALLSDGIRPRRGKFAHLVAAPLLGIPLFLAVQLLRDHPLALGLFLVPATFLAFLSTAWGRRGMPVAAALMFSMMLAMAPPPAASMQEALLRTAWCALGSALYVLYATAANIWLNGRYRKQVLAELLLSLATLMRTHARRTSVGHEFDVADRRTRGAVLRGHAALADQMQLARDLILEAPDTPDRQRIAGMLMVTFEIRDRLIAGELELERIDSCQADAIAHFADILCQMADDLENIADALLLGRVPALPHDHAAALAAIREQARAEGASPGDNADFARDAALVRSISVRIGDQNLALQRLAAHARGELPPDLSAVRTGWQLFVSPAYWSWQPLRALRWRQPALRHALRAALAIGTAYTLAQLLPWETRDYWILLTIVVVLRGSLAQTLARRDARVLGTLLGSVLAALLLTLTPRPAILLLIVVISQGIAHAYVARRYVVTAIAGSVLALLLSNLLYAGRDPAFDLIERVFDTLLGAGIAWAFSYVLPSWERDQIASLVGRVCRAMSQHASQSLALAAHAEVTGQPELTWRLARRETYDALAALINATDRVLAEPRAVRPPLLALEQLQGHGYQLLGQLSAIQSMLLLRRARLRHDTITAATKACARQIESILELSVPCQLAVPDLSVQAEVAVPYAVPEALPDPSISDTTPWLLRRLQLATALALHVRRDADRVLAATPGSRGTKRRQRTCRAPAARATPGRAGTPWRRNAR